MLRPLMKKEAFQLIGLLAVGILIIFFLFRFIGFDEIYSSLRELNIYYYLIVIALVIGASFLWALRWRVFVKKIDPKIKIKDLFKMMLVGQAVNNLTPIVKMGGEVARVYLLKEKFKIKVKEGFATVATDLTLEFIVDIVIVTVAVILMMIFTSPPTVVYLMILVFALVSSLIVFIILEIYLGYSKLFRMLLWLCKHIKSIKSRESEILEKYTTFRKNFKRSLQDRRMFGEGMALSFSRKGLDVLKYYLLLLALGHHLSFVNIVIAIGLSIMLLLIPGIPGNVGVYEGGMAAVFIFLGVPSGVAGTAVLLDRLVWYWGITGAGSMLGAKYGMDIISRRAHKEGYSTKKG